LGAGLQRLGVELSLKTGAGSRSGENQLIVKVRDLINLRQPCFSFEFFPPKTDAAAAELFKTIAALRDLEPAFVSVTYGAGGSTRTRTVELVKEIKNEIGIEAMAHLTCVGSTVSELRDIVRDLRDSGIENILALRGDPPKGASGFVATEGGFRYASEFIAMLSSEFEMCVGSACYPEVHPEAPDAAADTRNLVVKVNAGAQFLISQLFFDNDAFFGFVDRARAAGITVPIVPGVMPITSYDSIRRMTSLCGATIPRGLLAELERRAAEPEAIAELGVAYAALQCKDLLARGAPGIHFYTVNKSPATRAIVSALRASAF